jgi:hypothetical protein
LDKAADKRRNDIERKFLDTKKAKEHLTNVSMQSPEVFLNNAVDDRLRSLGLKGKGKGKGGRKEGSTKVNNAAILGRFMENESWRYDDEQKVEVIKEHIQDSHKGPSYKAKGGGKGKGQGKGKQDGKGGGRNNNQKKQGKGKGQGKGVSPSIHDLMIA